jgi:head-tail adaptor
MKCSKIGKKKRQYCSGDLVDEIIIQNRSITSVMEGVDFGEQFSDYQSVMACVNTTSGKTYFDGVSTETNVTHEIGFRFDESVTSESWILFDNRRFDILKIENLDEKKDWSRAVCVDRGLAEKSGSEI